MVIYSGGGGSVLAIFDVLLDLYYIFGILYTNNLGTRKTVLTSFNHGWLE